MQRDFKINALRTKTKYKLTSLRTGMKKHIRDSLREMFKGFLDVPMGFLTEQDETLKITNNKEISSKRGSNEEILNSTSESLTAVKNNRPTRNNRPSTIVRKNRPSTAIKNNRPSTAIKNNRPSTAIKNNRSTGKLKNSSESSTTLKKNKQSTNIKNNSSESSTTLKKNKQSTNILNESTNIKNNTSESSNDNILNDNINNKADEKLTKKKISVNKKTSKKLVNENNDESVSSFTFPLKLPGLRKYKDDIESSALEDSFIKENTKKVLKVKLTGRRPF